MDLIEYIGWLVIGLYSILIFYFLYGWSKLSIFTNTKNESSTPVSIVIACRNEEENIQLLIESLTLQTYPKDKTEIIIIDDHSSDNTKDLIEKYSQKNQTIKCFGLPPNSRGKKDALAFGVNIAQSNVIITTDADCLMMPDWLNTMMQYYSVYKPVMLSGPVTFTAPHNIFQKLQTLEFLSLIGAGAGAIGINKAIMCNAANLLFEKSLYNNSNIHNTFASGDDIFLMLSAKKNNTQNIHFIKSTDAIVYTKPVKTVKDFYQQRIRWASKSKIYSDFDIVFTATIVALTNLFLAFALISAPFCSNGFKFFIILFTIKTIVDFALMIPVTNFFGQQKSLWLLVPLQLIYPFYIVFTSIAGLIGNFTWKERKFKEKG